MEIANAIMLKQTNCQLQVKEGEEFLCGYSVMIRSFERFISEWDTLICPVECFSEITRHPIASNSRELTAAICLLQIRICHTSPVMAHDKVGDWHVNAMTTNGGDIIDFHCIHFTKPTIPTIIRMICIVPVSTLCRPYIYNCIRISFDALRDNIHDISNYIPGIWSSYQYFRFTQCPGISFSS